MSIRIEWAGLKELLAELKRLPAEIQQEATDIGAATAEDMARELTAAYPQGPTGTLKQSVRVEHPEPGVAIVRSVAPHAHFLEDGTAQRSTGSRRIRSRGRTVGRRQTGTPANRGRMTASKLVARLAVRHRARMTRRLIAMLERHGFHVTER